MKNNESGHHGANPSLGPAPTPVDRPLLGTLSAPRVALMGFLDAQPEPATITALSTALGLHPNTVREHVDALVGLGLVERQRAAAKGRGRPAWLYRSAPPDTTGGGYEYAGLASALAAQIARSSASPRKDATQAGRGWGRDLARAHPIEGRATLPKVRRAVLALLEELRFTPQSEGRGAAVKLTTCPLLDAAKEYPEIVCGVHLGIIRGTIEEYGADASDTALKAFAEPGACQLQLRARARR